MISPPPPGVYVPAVLFFDEHEELDIAAIKAHVLRLAQGGVAGILVQGSNGEAQHLSQEEKKQAISVTRITLDENGFKDVVVIAGTGAPSTRETKKLNVDAHEAGATYALVLTPGVWPKLMTLDNILRFHRETFLTNVKVADASPIPTMVYNFPGVTAGIDLDSDAILELAKHPNIVGTKLSCGNIGKIQRVTSTLPPCTFATYPGRSDVFIHGLNAGAAGVTSALVNIVPKLHAKLYRLWKAGRAQEAMELQARLGHGEWAASKVGGIGGIKAVVAKHFGYGRGYVRGPLKAVDDDKLVQHKYYQTLVDLIEDENRCDLSQF
ncbi:dihydrodipicolinate synthetase [Coprinopsis cinerea okayama7|uniref:Dihydrodipicolinate synthetase n=1 Tax=Coprinopsis cinerea (strain Okayama-7 / 130 / ATCC MYA-4618 / FGSC 9003) TaxID=240176 RepID=A8NTD2_COPC7|nr:dihydrodipicolinate synthetase [Coprinopsis cinerea okayama7\|eukprot:XP_001836200.2 dihydrodipicolinate synthetase [Coprinopsis cinerea okayama7\